MRIEILTRNTGKKPEIMTYLKRLKGFSSDGEHVSAEGVEAEITASYILITASKPWMADELVRILFDIRPVPYSSGFYEIGTDQRIIITCKARPVNEVISSLDTLEHLDHRAGELGGSVETRWNSRDVGICARYDVFIQGGVAVARVKFIPHFRESEHHCRGVISLASLKPGLTIFCASPEALAKPPGVSVVSLEAIARVSAGICADILNGCPGKISYRGEAATYQVQLEGRNNLLEVVKKGEALAEIKIHLEEPWVLEEKYLEGLGNLLGVKDAKIGRVIEGLYISPEDLVHNLGFRKEKDFSLFSRRVGEIEASYHIDHGSLRIAASVPWGGPRETEDIFSMIEEFTGRVISYAF